MPLSLSYSLADQDFARTKSLGIWNVATHLLQHLAERPEVERITVFNNAAQAGFVWPAKVSVQSFERARGGKLRRILWDQWGVYRAARQTGHPWLFLPKGYASFLRRCPVRLAAYVHDAMHDHYRRSYRPNPLGRETGYFLNSLRATLREADVIFTNSDFTSREVRRLATEWRLAEPRVCLAGIGFESPPVETNGARERILVLAGPVPHKCTRLAVDYLSRWAKGRTDIAGVDWIGSLPPGLVLPDLPGWRNHARLASSEYDRIAHGAKVAVYFSAYEGFGMPPVEATLAGAAAVYSAIPPMLEVMGDCGFPFANDAYEDFVGAMNRAMMASGSQLAEWKKTLSQRYRWEEVAKRIVAELISIQNAPRPGE